MKTDNTNIPTWLLRMCNQPLLMYMTFKQFGFFGGLKFMFRTTQIELYFWFIRNCKWYRNRVHKKVVAQFGEAGEIMFDMMVDVPNWDPKKLLNKHPEFKQQFVENFNEHKQSVLADYIKSGKLKTEEEIQEFNEQVKLENFI